MFASFVIYFYLFITSFLFVSYFQHDNKINYIFFIFYFFDYGSPLLLKYYYVTCDCTSNGTVNTIIFLSHSPQKTLYSFKSSNVSCQKEPKPFTGKEKRRKSEPLKRRVKQEDSNLRGTVEKIAEKMLFPSKDSDFFLFPKMTVATKAKAARKPKPNTNPLNSPLIVFSKHGPLCLHHLVAPTVWLMLFGGFCTGLGMRLAGGTFGGGL